MFIVKRRGEIARFGIFLLMAGLMVYFIFSRSELFQSTAARPQEPKAPAKVTTGLPTPAPASATPAVATDGSNFFAQFRIDREQQRSARQEELQAMIDNPNIDGDTRKAAAGELRTVQRLAALENQAETMVKAKGFGDVVVMLTEQSAQVVVRAASLTPQQAVQVLDTVSRLTGVKPSAIAVDAKER
ncbi:MAG TPA: SpoIIIAH-like family protein [Symbiobacteriaceae bacterium]|jgi:stage III sporulation protein AH|nr:SpoIIIAH-like family protein [Symbiobacteriaceae bacterium]